MTVCLRWFALGYFARDNYIMHDYSKYEFLRVDRVSEFVVRVVLNRPQRYNALNTGIWGEIGDVFVKIDTDEDIRVVILEGEGKAFTSGLDLGEGALMDITAIGEGDDIARKARIMLRKIKWMQDQFTRIEKCSKPVIAAIHGLCLGGGIDIITACDIRHCTKDVVFSVKEVDVGLAADVGSLNRLPKVCTNSSWVKEISLSARNFGSEEALKFNLVNRVYETREEMRREVEKLATTIASKSPIAVQGTKTNLNYAQDHTVDESLNFVATWNASQLLTEDIAMSGAALLSKQPHPLFSKL